jgi:hypothetical protein
MEPAIATLELFDCRYTTADFEAEIIESVAVQVAAEFDVDRFRTLAPTP